MAMRNRRLMKNLCYILLMTVLCLSACKQKLPPDIWEKEQMIEFLTEALLLEAKVSTAELPKQKTDSLYNCYYEELFAYYNTTQEIWQKNIEYYKDKPRKMDDIYKEVVSRLTLLENIKPHEHQRPKSDSVEQKTFKIQ